MKPLYFDVDPLEMDGRPGKGPIPANYAMVGIAPSTNRPRGRQNEPFGANSWQIVNSLTEQAEGQCYVTNLIKTSLAPGKKPGIRLIRQHTDALYHELEFVEPKRILAIGSEPAKVLCPGFKSMREDHGAFFYNERLHAYVIPTFHFAAAARNPEYVKIIKSDLKRFFTLPDPTRPEFIVLDDRQALYKYLESIPRGSRVFLDIESTGLDPKVDEIISIGMITPEADAVTVIYPFPDFAALKIIHDLFKIRDLIMVGHNLQFDLYFMKWKLDTHPWDLKVEDTMLMAFNQGEEILALKHLTTMMTDRPGSRSFGGPEDYAYLAEDVLSTRELYYLFDEPTKDAFSRQLLHDMVPITVNMRARGVHVEQSILQSVKDQIDADVAAKKKVLDDLVPSGLGEVVEINWNSGKQVAAFLIGQGVKLFQTTKSGAYAVSEAVLLDLAKKYPQAQALLDYRGATKLATFLHSYAGMTTDKHSFLHPRLLLTGARTGRLSCQDPNLQQVPRVGPVKLLFTPRWAGGKIGLIDLSQAELRVVAMLANDYAFAKMLMGADAHRTIAASIYRKPEEEVTSAERKKSKGVTFGLLYGGSAAGLATRVGVPVEEVKIILERFFNVFPDLGRWLDDTKEFGVREGYVTTPLGRRRDLTGLIASEGDNSAKRKAVNTPVQATASDIALMLMRYVDTKLREHGYNSRAMICVHDAVFLEIYPGEEYITAMFVQEAFIALKDSPLSEMEMFKFLPLVGEYIIGENWAKCESTNEAYGPEMTFPCSSLATETINPLEYNRTPIEPVLTEGDTEVDLWGDEEELEEDHDEFEEFEEDDRW